MEVLTKGCLELYFTGMAKQAGEIFIEGTIDELTFYKMEGAYYVRIKSSLTGKRFWKDRAFERSRKSCSRFGEGNRIASAIFQLVSIDKRTNRLFPFLRTKAIALLKEEKTAEEVSTLLLDYLLDFGIIQINGEPGKNNKPALSKRSEKKFMHSSSTSKLTSLHLLNSCRAANNSYINVLNSS